MKKLILLITSILLINSLGLIFTTLQTKANNQIIYVDDDNVTGPWDGTQEHPYQNITSALTYASSEDTIFIYKGTYYEQILITKPITLQGENKHGTIIDGNLTGDVIKITASNIKITECTIQNSSSTSSGINIASISNINISHTILKNNNIGIYLYASTNCTITNNEILNNNIGMRISGSQTNTLTNNNISTNTNMGIYISDSNNITTQNNTITNNQDFGISLIASTQNTITNNNISTNAKYGIYLFQSHNNILTNNNISSNNDFGIWFSQSTYNTIMENNILNNERFGVYLTNSTNNTITKNNIQKNNQIGIKFDYSDNNTIHKNSIQENLIRGTILYYSNNNTFLHNNFLKNKEALTNINSTNFFDNGFEGNYWSDYNGTDENQDGIGDTPYIIDENNQDSHPLMGQFSEFTIPYKEKMHIVQIISNSTITQLKFNETIRMLTFNATNPNNMSGFCRILTPEQLINWPQIVLIDNQEINATPLLSNTTHTLLYFTYKNTTQEIEILSEPFHELLTKLNTLQENYNNLNSIYQQLLAEYNTLNQTYYQLLMNHTELLTNYNMLNQTYQQTLANYTNLLAEYDTLKQTYQELKTNYTQLENDYNTIQTNYNTLLNEYNSLNSTYNKLATEYANIQTILQYISLAATAITLITSSLAIKNHKKFKEQKKLAEQYKIELEQISLLHTARSQFEADVERRTKKIEKFEQKYGVTVKPRNTLEDIITGLELKKKKEEKE